MFAMHGYMIRKCLEERKETSFFPFHNQQRIRNVGRRLETSLQNLMSQKIIKIKMFTTILLIGNATTQCASLSG